ncbi:hypothetical protein HaLaN_20021 [Haematococcus lacustris]|uniref:Uncharacterized protein n=1 Tax=Haematococcus lacustris TaxID=44745 RepID=A0A699ZIW2_HAELA|nr:hypothetical protein HaLaN_20021 [Haematococcus lacustris]
MLWAFSRLQLSSQQRASQRFHGPRLGHSPAHLSDMLGKGLATLGFCSGKAGLARSGNTRHQSQARILWAACIAPGRPWPFGDRLSVTEVSEHVAAAGMAGRGHTIAGKGGCPPPLRSSPPCVPGAGLVLTAAAASLYGGASTELRAPALAAVQRTATSCSCQHTT